MQKLIWFLQKRRIFFGWVVVACGICACSAGIFHDCYNVIGGVDKAIPVDVYAPGCAVRPETIIDAVLKAVEILDEKAKRLAAGEDPATIGKPMPETPNAPVDERHAAAEATAKAAPTGSKADAGAKAAEGPKAGEAKTEQPAAATKQTNE